MAQDLRARLERIRLGSTRSPGSRTTGPEQNPGGSCSEAACVPTGPLPDWKSADWESAGWESSDFQSVGFQTRRRTAYLDFSPPPVFPPSLEILIPDLARYASIEGAAPDPASLLFFDLETTGLSGGAGTVAFLAALGRFAEGGLRVDQYLLLDYPGESDFLEALLGEFGSQGKPPLLVTYNGKSFDAQILRSRCLMNGIKPPPFYHADLLHPARRLWKRALPSCSQAEIEVSVLNLDRTGDLSGALAPEIWFSFLKNGETGRLLGICEHNKRDIIGLARLFAAFTHIAADPEAAEAAYKADLEALALLWREYSRRIEGPAAKAQFSRFFTNGQAASGFCETKLRLMEAAAARGFPRAMYFLGRDLLREGRLEEGRLLLMSLAEGAAQPTVLRALAYRALAIDAEWRLRDRPLALSSTEAGLVLNAGGAVERDLLRRCFRLAACGPDA